MADDAGGHSDQGAGPTLEDFAGHWTLSRRIDHADGATARAEGSARFTSDGEGLTLFETGVLRIQGAAQMRFERSYLWRKAGGGGIAVFFDDGRPFHYFAPDQLQDRHDCPPDLYRVSYNLSRLPGEWRVVWRVIGPRKNYRMDTTYCRADSALA